MGVLIYYRYLLICCAFLVLSCSFGQAISELSGVVEIRPQLNAMWRPAELGDVLNLDASIRSFEGSVSLRFDNDDIIKLATNSELANQPEGLKLVLGKAYVNAWQLALTEDVRVSGEVRLDQNEFGWRVAVLSGQATVADYVNLKPAQQLTINSEGEASFSTFTEQDPWYRNFNLLGKGDARVIGVQGQAEFSLAENWQDALIDAVVSVGSSVRTGADSWLELRFDDGNVVRLQADTELLLARLEDLEDQADGSQLRQTVLELRYGKVWVIVDTEEQPFKIETPGLIAGVRGTKFRLDAASEAEPALIKTFEGLVASTIGFEETLINQGQQFDPNVGVESLRLDALDEMNLAQDRLLTAPTLNFPELSFKTLEGSFALLGETDPETLITVNGQTLSSKDGSFSSTIPLLSGFNLVRVTARAGEKGVAAEKTFPVIKESPDLFIDALIRETSTSFLIEGVASAGSSVTLTGLNSSLDTLATEQNRFEFVLRKRDLALTEPLELTLSAELNNGMRVSKNLIIKP